MRRERKPSRTRGLWWFLLGALVGANAMYYAMTHDIGRRLGLQPAPSSDRVETPIPIGDGAAPAIGDPLGSGTAPIQPVLGPPVVRAAGGPLPAAAGAMLSAGQLLVPVQGITPAQLVDTFTDSRSEGRSHDAIDIMAPHGTPVLAVADGRIEKVFNSRLGGLTLYQYNRERTHAYYYAHLQGYADGMLEQRDLRRGEVLGYVGVTGNSNPDGPHLHFAIFQLEPEKQWWKGTAVNPFGLLGGVAPTR